MSDPVYLYEITCLNCFARQDFESPMEILRNERRTCSECGTEIDIEDDAGLPLTR
jgi:hypothetical protein